MPAPAIPPAVPPRARFLSRLLTEPLSTQHIERRVRSAAAPAGRRLVLLVPLATLAALGCAALSLWSLLPPESGARHWLVLGWMEGGGLAVCNFRFAGDQDELSPDEEMWSRRLLAGIPRPECFRAGVLPAVRLRVPRGNSMPRFGPETPER